MRDNADYPTSGDRAGDEPALWRKLARQAGRAGREVVERALQLHYAAQRPDTPAWARRTAYGALAYFILPTDAVPDFLAGVGYTDDLAALTAAIATLSAYIDDGVRARARERARAWFG
ncbi:hypothetical protein PC39_03582 [Salinisphaera sp. PC39]|uniref:YkvA family protein n=1 Tax=Salinisphaera sp. PC39 TaxID=1304156 RepID=UPI00333FDE7E